MTISRRRFLESSAELGAVSVLAGAPAMAAAGGEARFFVIGDWGRDGKHHQRAVAGAMAAAAVAADPAFIVSAGDNFYEAGVTGLSDPQWRTSFEDVYSQESLQRPWHVILGNHDYRGNVEAQLAYSKLSHRWEMPARYYTRKLAVPGGGAEIFYLDTSPFIRKYAGTVTNTAGQDKRAQLAWLERGLAASGARWKIVIGHHPLYTALGGHGHDQPDMIAAFEPVLRRHKVALYINGHDHSMQYVEMGGIAYVTTGAGSHTYQPGPASRAGYCSGDHGFLAVAVGAAAVRLDFIDARGKSVFGKTLGV
ncbi:MAG: acid phosphatase [Acidiphilium sp. 37-64-53]|jgi:acid phosphatase|uniref:metallophosphoesterase n=1 Tax=Acidiphilium TaxID=522 RepID=UPI000BC5F38A|nr:MULTISPECIES: metallophosphoesterase [Acidiphilium]OYW02184.1 MAG: acid phosphatase [Acidiphilium sp. 37-64-53]OZB22793.1 MAG: acid phosphatase [Acidiphilium sp. 34-64-41]HQT85579.1 metallophosphoesterase [Acidiphilium rubrum]